MKVAVCFATGYEEIEALAVVDILRRGKVEVIMMGVTGSEVTSARGVTVKMDQIIEEVNFEEIEMLVLPGGIPGVDHLESSSCLMAQLKAFKENNKWLAAICAAPSILGKLGLLGGQKATCYPGYEEQLIGCEHMRDSVVTSGKFVTGKGAGYSTLFALELLSVIKGKDVAEQVKQGMLIE